MAEEVIVCFYGGTGIAGITKPFGERYYRLALTETGAKFIPLHFAGLLGPRLRRHGAEGARRQAEGTGLPWLILIGHSQGALEALAQGMKHSHRVLAIILLSPPLDGAPLATAFKRVLLLPGLRQMVQGSEQNNRLHHRTRTLGWLHAKGDTTPLPHVHIIAALCDGLVPTESAWAISDLYPHVTRYLLSSRNIDVPESVQLVPTRPWGDNHLAMMWQPELVQLLGRIVKDARAETVQRARPLVAAS